MNRRYTKEAIYRVWGSALVIEGYNSSEIRADRCGATIIYSHYGDRNSRFGWEIDHIVPISKGGTNTYNNVQPLHWKNNATKGDGPLVCTVNSNMQ